MPAPAADSATELAAPAACPATSGSGGPDINPATGLSTDYLNHFTEAIMVLEMAGAAPDCLDDLRRWGPRTYAEHFAGSRFSNRQAILAAYETASPAVRQSLDQAADMLNATLRRACEMMLQHAGTAEAEAVSRRALERLRPLMARTAAVINGDTDNGAPRQGPQAAIDAMFGP